MVENFSTPEPPLPPATPPAAAGLDVNFCKNPRCANFGVRADIVKFRRTKSTGLAAVPGTAYGLVATGKKRPALKCLLCGEIFGLKSNLAIIQELARYWYYLEPAKAACCPNSDCTNVKVPIGSKGAYHKFGTTAAGTPRYRCRVCGATLAAGGRALKKQRITHMNKTVLMAVTNKMPMRRICKVTGLNPGTLYGKIEFLHKQCQAFAAAKERVLPERIIERLYISVDRQDYMVNWSRQDDRRNIVLHAVGSADNPTGYVFGMHLNYDGAVIPDEVEADAMAIRDSDLPAPHRKHARLWLQADYQETLKANQAEATRKSLKAARGPAKNTIGAKIEDAYEAAAIREDSEVSALKNEDQMLPSANGMQVHEEYCLYAHFQFLRRLLSQAQKIRFFLDQDSGIRAACFAAFPREIQEKRVDAFFVRIAKEMTIDKKRSLITKSRAAFKAVQDANPGLKPWQVEVLMMREEIGRSVAIGKWADRWCMHPMPTMSEPSKAMSWQTDLGTPEQGYSEEHKANLFLKASLRGIDNFFQRVRRSVNLLERPLLTASAARRTWYGYSPYNPEMVKKLLDIYRVMHNFVEVGKDGKTPAMRLGLTERPIAPEDIIYWT